MTALRISHDNAWTPRDLVALGLVVGAHVLGLWQFVQTNVPLAMIEAAPLEISLVIPPDEPPPPEPPKPIPPREIPKPQPKPIPQPAVDPPPVISDVPTDRPIEPPPPPPPAPPAPTPPPVAQSTSGSYLLIKTDCKPVYPRKALREGIEGKVTLIINVDERGIPDKVDVVQSSGNFELDNAARAAAGRCVFVPQTVNGVAVKSRGLRDIVFKLNEG